MHSFSDQQKANNYGKIQQMKAETIFITAKDSEKGFSQQRATLGQTVIVMIFQWLLISN